jgi:hypothetical protein
VESRSKFEAWAIVELFGHQRMSGLCTAVDIGGASFVRIDVPDIEKPDSPPKLSRLVNPTAIYSITPVTEETARAAAKSCSVAPVTEWDVRELIDREVKRQSERKQLSRPTGSDEEEEEMPI